MPKSTKAQSKAVAKREQSTELAAGSDFEQYAGAGLENVGAGDILVPRITIIQDLSPQVKEGKSDFIEGAKAGDICDVGTNELFEQPLIVLPVLFRKEYLEWAPRNSGKGLVNIHSDPSILNETTQDDKRRNVLPNGNYIAETAQFYIINLSTPDRRKSFIPMTSTQLKKARRWNTLASGEKLKRKGGGDFQAPLFYRTYNLSSASESNNEGDWFGWVIERGETLQEYGSDDWKTLFEEAVAFREALSRGEVRGNTEDMETEASQPSGDEARM